MSVEPTHGVYQPTGSPAPDRSWGRMLSIAYLLLAEGVMYLSKIENLSIIPNLASEIGALCHIFLDIDVFSAFHKAALLGTTLGKALKMFFACSPLICSWTAP